MNDLDDSLRQADPDRWLASRFIGDETARDEVVALYALNNELARATQVARDALMGEIRLTWWIEAMEEIASGRPHRRHPVVDALAHSAFDPAALAKFCEGRLVDLEPGPFPDEASAFAYIDATAGSLMALAAQRLDPAAQPAQVRAAGHAWGLAGLHRVGGRLPAAWSDDAVRRQVKAQIIAANREANALPAAAFPAMAYATLATRLLTRAPPGELGRRARLIWAVALGRI
jgi:phytoene synthase